MKFLSMRDNCAASFLFALSHSSVHAQTTNRQFFRAGAVVIVFSSGDFVENNGDTPLAHDFVLLDDVASDTVFAP